MNIEEGKGLIEKGEVWVGIEFGWRGIKSVGMDVECGRVGRGG